MHTATELVLKSGICPQTHLQVQKRIYAQGRGFAVEYTHTNISQGVLSLAPWGDYPRGRWGNFFLGKSTPQVQSTLALSHDGNCWWHEYKG